MSAGYPWVALPGEAVEKIQGAEGSSGRLLFHANEWISGVRSVYTKNDKYVPRQEAPSNTAGGKVVNFERVEWLIQPDPGTGMSALMAGEVDWVDQPLFDHLPVLQRKFPGAEVLRLPEARHHLVNEREELRQAYFDFLRERLR